MRIEPTDREFVGSFARGLKVIRAFNADRPTMTVAEVAKATEMTRAGARRLLLTLHSLGYVETDGKQYGLTPRVLELGFAYLGSRSWLANATPLLSKLREELNESVSVTVLEDFEVVYVARFPADRVITMSMEVGSRRPAFCTAMGRVLLGEFTDECARQTLLESNIKKYTANTITDVDEILEQIRDARSKGYALINQELEPGLVAVSRPLRGASGAALAAVNICGHSSHLSMEDLEERCLPALTRTINLIQQTLV